MLKDDVPKTLKYMLKKMLISVEIEFKDKISC